MDLLISVIHFIFRGIIGLFGYILKIFCESVYILCGVINIIFYLIKKAGQILILFAVLSYLKISLFQNVVNGEELIYLFGGVFLIALSMFVIWVATSGHDYLSAFASVCIDYSLGRTDDRY